MPLYGYLNFRIHEDEQKALNSLAQKEHRSVGAMIRECIRREVERQSELESRMKEAGIG
jgi:predicted transcriptional regulator